MERPTLEERLAYASGLHALAEFIASNDLPRLPSETVLNLFLWSKDDFLKCARLLHTFEKGTWGTEPNSYMKLSKAFGPLSLEVSAPQNEVCTRIVTGKVKRTVKIPVTFREEEVEEDQVKWDCGSILEKIDPWLKGGNHDNR
jgi:hypothetical protein